jgi:hypothetical protein
MPFECAYRLLNGCAHHIVASQGVECVLTIPPFGGAVDYGVHAIHRRDIHWVGFVLALNFDNICEDQLMIHLERGCDMRAHRDAAPKIRTFANQPSPKTQTQTLGGLPIQKMAALRYHVEDSPTCWPF